MVLRSEPSSTAASLWAASAIGFAVSTGGAFLIVAAAATMLTLFTLSVVDNLESRLVPQGHLRELHVVTGARSDLAVLAERLEQRGFHVEGVRIESEDPVCIARLEVFGGKGALIQECLRLDGVKSAELK